MIDRPRRLRQNPALRAMVAETRLHPKDLVLPVFVAEGIDGPRPISSMPGVLHHDLDSLVETARRAVSAGVGGIMLFGVPEAKDATGSGAVAEHGILNVGLRAVRDAVGDDLVVMADTCLDEFTDHGHCGVLDGRGRVDNDATNEIYADMAVAQARSGAHVVGPSRHDGRSGRRHPGRLWTRAGFEETVILAYAAKYASAFYGPFREAVQSSLVGDRRTYQQDPANVVESLREIDLDLAEGADMVMVKPAMSYLDVVAAAAERATVPVAAYQVSGEYSMIEAAAERGWIDRRGAALEALTSIRRAGAQVVLTYYALDVPDWLG